MEETNLEKALKNLFASIKVNFSGRVYHELWRQVSDKEGKKKSKTYPWFCANENELKDFYGGWSFFYHSTHKRFDSDYVAYLYFFALAQHDSKNKACLSNPFNCIHTIDFTNNFFCRLEEDQIDAVNTLIKNGWYYDYFQVVDNKDKNENNTLLKIMSRPKFRLEKEGYFVKDKETNYTLIGGDALLRAPIPLQELYRSLEDKIKDGIQRSQVMKDKKLLGTLKTFLTYDYK